MTHNNLNLFKQVQRLFSLNIKKWIGFDIYQYWIVGKWIFLFKKTPAGLKRCNSTPRWVRHCEKQAKRLHSVENEEIPMTGVKYQQQKITKKEFNFLSVQYQQLNYSQNEMDESSIEWSITAFSLSEEKKKTRLLISSALLLMLQASKTEAYRVLLHIENPSGLDG